MLYALGAFFTHTVGGEIASFPLFGMHCTHTHDTYAHTMQGMVPPTGRLAGRLAGQRRCGAWLSSTVSLRSVGYIYVIARMEGANNVTPNAHSASVLWSDSSSDYLTPCS